MHLFGGHFLCPLCIFWRVYCLFFFKDVNMKNTASKFLCMVYCALKNLTLFTIKGRSLNSAHISRNEGVQSQNKSLIDLILSKPSNTSKQSKTKKNKTKPFHQITETVKLTLKISRAFKDHK